MPPRSTACALVAAVLVALTMLGTPATASATPAVAITDVTVTEGTGSTVQAVFTISLSEPSLNTVTVNAATAPGNAAGGVDFSNRTAATVTFSPGQTTRTYNVAVLGDSIDEHDEQFAVNLSDPSLGATIADEQGIGTIADNDPPPSLNVTDVTVTEGDSSVVQAVFTISLSAPSGKTVSSKFGTVADSASASDFAARSDVTISFSPGVGSRLLAVAVRPDLTDEYDEAFHLDASEAENAVLARLRATATIADNDAAPTLTISDATAIEDDATYVQAASTLTLSATSAKPISVRVSTVPDTAGTADYSPRLDASVSFPPGARTRQFNVGVRPDTTDEFDERLFLDVTSPENVSVPQPRATDTIVDNDPLPSLSVADVAVTEGDGAYVNAVSTLTLSAASAKPITVRASTAPGAATIADYSPRIDSTVSFPPSTRTRPFAVAVRPDTMDEYDEPFHLDLSAPENATLATTRSTNTILDNDAPPTISISDDTVAEPETASVTASARISLSQKSGKPVSVTHEAYDGSATDAFDYTPLPAAAVDVPAGSSGVTVPVEVLSDDEREPDEAFGRRLSEPTNATIADADGTTTISANCWDREPSARASALLLGSIAGNAGSGSLIGPPFSAICAGEEDWYRFELREDELDPCPPDPDPNDLPCDPPPPDDGPLSATVELDVQDGGLSGNLDLVVYDADGDVVGTSANFATMDESVTFAVPNAAESDDTQSFYVAIAGAPDPDFGAASNDYLLSVAGNTQPP